jgi:hypothetical protein
MYYSYYQCLIVFAIMKKQVIKFTIQKIVLTIAATSDSRSSSLIFDPIALAHILHIFIFMT